MESKCSRKSCNFVQDVAHMDEALDVLQQHYRAVHPTKGFYRNREIETLESWNLTADEYMESYNIGTPEVPEYDWRTLRHQVNRFADDRYAQFTNPTTQAEVRRKVEEHDQQAQNAPQPAGNAQDGPVVAAWDELNNVIEEIAPPGMVPPFVDVGRFVNVPGDNGPQAGF